MLGGEIIRDLNETPSLRKVPVNQLLCDVIGDDGGPLIHHGDSEEQQLNLPQAPPIPQSITVLKPVPTNSPDEAQK